jgi:hypothetical protein
MKRTLLLAGLLLLLITAKAQKVTEKHLDFAGKKSVEMNIQIADSISIHTWKKNEVYAKASIDINDNKDNEAYMISFDETGSSEIINGKFRDNYFKGKDNCCNEAKIYWQVYIPENVSFNVETINGDITIDGSTDGIKAKSISGFIDLSVPSKRAADIELSTITGIIYSNHEFTANRKNMASKSEIRQKINEGGVRIKLETISGDIFFRKSD